MKEEVTFLIPSNIKCHECDGEIDIEKTQVIMVVICPHCGDTSQFREDNKLH